MVGQGQEPRDLGRMIALALIGQAASPTDWAASTKAASTIAASTEALTNESRWSLARGWPRRSWMRRWRRSLPQNTSSTGAVAIHRLPGSSASIA